MAAFSLPVHGLLSGRTEGPPPRSGPGLGDGGPQARILVPQADPPHLPVPERRLLRVRLASLGSGRAREPVPGEPGLSCNLEGTARQQCCRQAGRSPGGKDRGVSALKAQRPVPPQPHLFSQAPRPTRVSCSRLPCDVGSLGSPRGRAPCGGRSPPSPQAGLLSDGRCFEKWLWSARKERPESPHRHRDRAEAEKVRSKPRSSG